MDIRQRGHRLIRIYEIYDAFTTDVNRACRKHCAACCTCNVTGTTLEGWLIYDHLTSGSREPDRFPEESLKDASCRRFQPKVTLNELVALCLDGQEPPDEYNDPSAGACPLIQGDVCSIYPVRPFGCRAMLSTDDCGRVGEAQMPPLILSVNNVVMQFIEALDRPGATGNMADLLLFLSDTGNRECYVNRQDIQWMGTLRANQPFSALMIPPEHRQPLQPLLQALRKAVRAEVGQPL